jgi:putative oxidoreductase
MKLFGWFGLMPPCTKLTPLLYAAAIMEVVGGPLIVLGLFTRPVAFLLSGEMAYAYFSSHAPKSFWPIVNRAAGGLLRFIFLFCRRRRRAFSLDS